MEEILNSIIAVLLPQNNLFLYFFLFFSAIMENLFPPIPGDTITAFGAFLVGTGRLNYSIVYISTTCGSVIGFMMLFYLGRYLGKEFFVQKNFNFFNLNQINKAENHFNRFGYAIVVLNRFFPGIRSVISITSGILKFNHSVVWILSFISAAIWNLIWIHTGYLLGNNWDSVKVKMSSLLAKYNLFAGITITIFILIYIAYRIHNYHKSKKTSS